MAIAMREYRSFLRVPVGWVVIALYVFIAGLVFGFGILEPGGAATLRGFFEVSGWLLLPVAPAISMRLLSEELRSGTIEPLMTSPVSEAGIVAGKFAGAMAFLLTMLAPSAAYVVLLYLLSNPAPDPGPIAAGYVCLLLTGSLYVAIGVLGSALTNNQTLAYLGPLFAILLLLMAPQAAGPLHIPVERFRPIAVGERIADFAKGVVSTGNIAFFAVWTAFFLALAAVAVQSRRWR